MVFERQLNSSAVVLQDLFQQLETSSSQTHDMDGKKPLNPQKTESNVVTTETDTTRPTPPPDATLMPYFSTADIDPLFARLSHPESSIPPFYHLIQPHAILPQQTDFPWNTSIPQHSFQQLPQAGPSQYPMSALQFQGHSDMTQGTTGPQPPPPPVATSDAIGHPPIPPEVELEAAEEKRHRNTAASARFRIKKKHKTIALERSVTDLTGRAKELEREVADLRRENGWLKDIVMLKGAQYAANNQTHQEALRQAASLVTGGRTEFSPPTVSNSKEEESEDLEAEK